MRPCTIVASIAIAANAFAQTIAPMDNFSVVTNLWYNGYKSNVLAIAEQRLAVNSNDLAGLVIRMDFNSEFSNEECFSNDIYAVLSASALITNSHFRSVFSLLVMDLTNQLSLLATEYRMLPAEEKQKDKFKWKINGKPMDDEDVLKALHDDGLF